MNTQVLSHLQSALRITELIKSAARAGKLNDAKMLGKAMQMVEKELSLAVDGTLVNGKF